VEFEEYKEKLVGRRFTDEQIEAAWRSRDRCDLCPKFLNDPCTGFVMTRDNGASEPKLLVIGEAPGGEEAQQGICFVGPAARHGKSLMEKAGVPMDQVRFTNAVRCFPHDDNGSPEPPDERDAMACMPYLFDYIDEVRPKVLFTFGKVPTQLILGQSVAITKIAGNIFRTKIRGRDQRHAFPHLAHCVS
jgi:DNA polymerase